MEIQFDTDASLEARTKLLNEFLHEGVCEVTFTKIDGSVRVMPCTLNSALLPAKPVTESTAKKKSNPDNLSVWCTDKSEWRSFRIANVTKLVLKELVKA